MIFVLQILSFFFQTDQTHFPDRKLLKIQALNCFRNAWKMSKREILTEYPFLYLFLFPFSHYTFNDIIEPKVKCSLNNFPWFTIIYYDLFKCSLFLYFMHRKFNRLEIYLTEERRRNRRSIASRRVSWWKKKLEMETLYWLVHTCLNPDFATQNKPMINLGFLL